MTFILYFEIEQSLNNWKIDCAPNWARPSATVTVAQTDRARRAFRQRPGRDRPPPNAIPADPCHLSPGLHAPHMQLTRVQHS
jgi:hypothetical protein